MANEKILVVDDEEHIAELISYNLISNGYKVITANNGIDAIKLAIEEKPSIILLDLMIPGKDGYDVCKEIRNYKEIISCSDGIIIARGDLVPECGLITSVEEEFDLLRNLKSSNYNKDIIIATHILDSMKNGFSSTISELESIYTFINSGVTGFLLAGETSVGKKPVETVKLLKQLIRAYEKKLPLNCGQT